MVITFPSRHLPLELLWRFAHDLIQLTPGQMTHVTQCDECMSMIGLSTLYESIAEVEKHLDWPPDDQAAAAG